ncbi:CotS family spore coat protein [Clostridium polynesiense]|uniref:CotS family spore coat protein n=1 Tax=Clostridium polynesiense TaxID=1325933 RepID=UPI000B2360FD|nr:CotS family spore coat protein [Clostridium polynesiense]
MLSHICVYDEDILYGEKNILEKVLKNYNLNILEVYRKRSAYKVVAKEGLYCLKRMKHGEHKVKNGYILTKELNRLGFYNTAEYMLTANKKLYVKEAKYIFYLTTWIDGIESNLYESKEISECIKLLAKFHLAVQNINIGNLLLEDNSNKWIRHYENKLNDLKLYEKIIKEKLMLSQFDNLYEQDILDEYNYGRFSLDLISSCDYNIINSSMKGICHDSFYYQNIITMNDEYYIIDLDSIVMDIQIVDLAKLIRRLMYSHNYKWDFNKAKVIIETYNSVKKISPPELKLMLAVIAFPHRFWKIGKKRYIKPNQWSEIRFYKKLKKYINIKRAMKNF